MGALEKREQISHLPVPVNSLKRLCERGSAPIRELPGAQSVLWRPAKIRFDGVYAAFPRRLLGCPKPAQSRLIGGRVPPPVPDFVAVGDALRHRTDPIRRVPDGSRGRSEPGKTSAGLKLRAPTCRCTRWQERYWHAGCSGYPERANPGITATLSRPNVGGSEPRSLKSHATERIVPTQPDAT
jgi:hypothetical protein